MLDQAHESFAAVQEFLAKLNLVAEKNLKIIKSRIDNKKFEKDFEKALDDDFNTPKAIAALFDFINKANKNVWHLSPNEAEAVSKSITNHLELIGVNIKKPKIPDKIKKLAAKRELFRKNKQFIQADILRNQINRLGYTLEDTPLGPLIKPHHGYQKSKITAARP